MKSDDWKLSGHGIRVPSLSQMGSNGMLADLSVKDGGKGSFTQLAIILGSPSLSTPVGVDRLWSAIPEMAGRPLAGGVYVPPLVLREDPPRYWEGPTPLIHIEGVPEEVSDPRRFLSNYPSIYPVEGYENPLLSSLGHIDIAQAGHYYSGGFSAMHGTTYINRKLAFPAFPGNSASLHPILLWWAVLYVLSMCARYEPVLWARLIDVDSSRDAVSIEEFLNAAEKVLPALALQGIKEVSESMEGRRATIEDMAARFVEPPRGEWVRTLAGKIREVKGVYLKRRRDWSGR